MGDSFDGFWPSEERAFPAPLTIGVVADTHIYPHGRRRLPVEIIHLFQRFDVGLILHCGDINTVEVLAELGAVAPVLAVVGNNDDTYLRQILPMQVRFTVGRSTFALLHGHLGTTARASARQLIGEVDCVVYGHSHIPKIEQEDGTILFNPGSATDRRWQELFGVGLIHVTDGQIEPELVLYRDPRDLRNVRPGPAVNEG
ncbi:MAG TPA: metallophosphoesterase [Thermomicrobiales bacterium]|nr:metallophosphoesterase [Thermomicrobiales bacterium]